MRPFRLTALPLCLLLAAGAPAMAETLIDTPVRR